MKKLIIALVAFAFIASVSQAASFTSIGYIDVQKAFKGYKETAKSQADLAKEEESFKKDFEDSQKKLEAAQKEGKKPEELEKMKKEMEDRLSPKRENLLKLNEQLTLKLQAKIVDAVKAVAKKVGIEVVLDKQVLIIGGMDLTDMVLTELNK